MIIKAKFIYKIIDENLDNLIDEIKEYPINKEALSKWVKLNDRGKYKLISEFIASNITHASFSRFCEILNKMAYDISMLNSISNFDAIYITYSFAYGIY